MATIGEVGEQLSTILNTGDSTGLISLLQAAAARAEIELGVAVGATSGSNTEEAHRLRDRLYEITTGLGQLANSALQAAEEKNALLGQWGVTGKATGHAGQSAATTPSPMAATPAPPTTPQAEQPVKPDPIDEQLSVDIWQMGPMRLRHLRARGIHSLRDVLVAGTGYIHNTAEVGIKVTTPLQEEVSAACQKAGVPNQQITHRPSVTQIAALCGDLRQVSFAALHVDTFTAYHGQALGLSNRSVSVHDLITLTPDGIINYSSSGRFSDYDKAQAREHFNALIHRARIFAAEFDMAKRRLP